MAGIEITTKIGCTASCSYCPQEKLIKAYRERSDVLIMDFDTYKRCLDKIPPSVNVLFAGMCEPWLNSDCTKMLLYAHEKGHKIEVNTTLVGLKESDIDLLEDIPFEYFYLHLPSLENHETFAINDEYFATLKRISHSKIDAIYNTHGKTLPPEIFSIIKNGNPLHYRFTGTRAGNIKLNNNRLPRKKRGVISCGRDLKQNILLPNGDVALCCMDYGLDHLLGNLLSSDYGGLYRGKEFEKIKEGLKDDSQEILCRYCELFACNVDMRAKLSNPSIPLLLNTLKNSYISHVLRKIIKLFH